MATQLRTQTFDSTLGAAFCGFTASSILYGILCIQIYAYFDRFRIDRPVYKGLVVVVWILETFHQALVGHTVYHYAISNFTNPLALLFPVWSLIIQVTFGAFISVVVKSCFTMRVWRFSNRNVPMTLLITSLNVAQLCLGLVFTAKAFTLETFLELPKLKVLTTVTLGVGVISDLIIAGYLTYLLHNLRNGHSSNTLVNGLIRYSIETGAVTSICSTCTLVTFDLLPMTFVFLSFYFVLSKLYSNSLLTTLNTRTVIRGVITDRQRTMDDDFSMVRSVTRTDTTRTLGQDNLRLQKVSHATDVRVNVYKDVDLVGDSESFYTV